MCYTTLILIFLYSVIIIIVIIITIIIIIIIIITIIIITIFIITFFAGQPNPTCILYIGDGSSDGEIKLFINNVSSWDKVLSAKEKRLKTLMTSKYIIILYTFPDVFQSNHGYHTLCYKNFTAFSTSPGHLKKIFQPAKRSTTRSKVPTIPSTSTGCFPALCIFCGKIRKRVKGK